MHCGRLWLRVESRGESLVPNLKLPTCKSWYKLTLFLVLCRVVSNRRRLFNNKSCVLCALLRLKTRVTGNMSSISLSLSLSFFSSFFWLPLNVNQTWDEELANVAQRLAEQCLFEHDCNECRKVGKFSSTNILRITRIKSACIPAV